MTTDGHGRLKSGEMEERKCAYDKCDAHFECDKLSPKKYHSPRCSTLDAADKTAQQAKIKEAIRICKNQRCPQKTAKGTCGGRLTREGILVYCTRTDCDYSFNVKLPGSVRKSEDTVPSEETLKDDEEDGESDRNEEAEEQEAVEEDTECDVEGEPSELPGGIHEATEDEGDRILAELHEGCGLFSDPTPNVKEKQLVLLLAKLDEDTMSKVILTAKRLHAVIHSLKDLS